MPAATFSSRVMSTSSTPAAPLSSQNQRLSSSSPLPGPIVVMTASSLGDTDALERRSRLPDIQAGPIQPVMRPNSSKPVKRSAWVIPTPWREDRT
jgi:hypothetical protein